MVNEKNTRGAMRSEVERRLRKDTVVLVDSINNIKVLLQYTCYGCTQHLELRWLLALGGLVEGFYLAKNSSLWHCDIRTDT